MTYNYIYKQKSTYISIEITQAIIAAIIAILAFAPISYVFVIPLLLTVCVRVLLTICRFSVGPETRVWHCIPQRCQQNCSNSPHECPLNLWCRNVWLFQLKRWGHDHIGANIVTQRITTNSVFILTLFFAITSMCNIIKRKIS